MGDIIGFFQSLWNLILGSVRSLVMAVEMIAGSISFLDIFISYLPTAIASGVIIYLAVYVIRFICLK